MVQSQNSVEVLAEDQASIDSNIVLLNTQQWDFLRKRYRLTNRELDIAQLLCRGLSNEQVASRLNIKKGTVKTHVRNIYRKTWVNNKITMLLKFMEDAAALPLGSILLLLSPFAFPV